MNNQRERVGRIVSNGISFHSKRFFFFIILDNCVFNLRKDDLEIERSLLDSKRESNREEV